MLEYLITNARIIDGTGKPSYTGSVGIKEGKLVMTHGKEMA
jgi:N-acyl-D-aspartate/D-glutamate deacylase